MERVQHVWSTREEMVYVAGDHQLRLYEDDLFRDIPIIDYYRQQVLPRVRTSMGCILEAVWSSRKVVR